MRVLFACAGTGGHLLPAIVLARGLREREKDMEVLFCLSDDRRGANILDREGFPWETISVRPFPRSVTLESVAFPLSLLRGLRHGMALLRRFGPQVVVGTGGYVSGPVLFAAWMTGIPFIIQEQNDSPGLANRVLAPLADEIHVAFPDAVHFPGVKRRKVFLTGNPVAGGTNGGSSPPSVRRDRPGEPPVLLVMGGSQGAHPINRIAVRLLHSFDPLRFRVFFQTGERDYAWVLSSFEGLTPKPHVRPFFDDMPSIYRDVDLAICRAGAMTLSEIALWGIPSILIPYPHAAGGHQERNARHYERAGAAIVIREEGADWRLLKDRVESVLDKKGIWNEMSRAALSLRRPEAKDILVDRILALGR